MARVTLQQQLNDARIELAVAARERDVAQLELARLRAIAAVLKAALEAAEADERER